MPKKGYKQTIEHKKKINTPERAIRISNRMKGWTPRGSGWHWTKEHKKGISNLMKGRIGRKHSEETKKKLSLSLKGEKSPFWKGGISFEPYSIDWTETLKRSIRERDKYTCQICDKDA